MGTIRIRHPIKPVSQVRILPGAHAFAQLRGCFRRSPRADAPEPSLTTFQGIADEITDGLPIRLSDLTWASQFTTSERIVERYRTGRVFVAGDAAQVYSPAGGQGMTTGVQDVYNLAWKLAAALGDAPDCLLDTYEAERRPAAQQALIDSGHRFEEVLTTTEDPHSDPRQIWKTVNNRETSQLGITYRATSHALRMASPGQRHS
jgi:2-polyprenyl-6-methoxyphenol hydroxylase-like FAD-dependent oxidoreductase